MESARVDSLEQHSQPAISTANNVPDAILPVDPALALRGFLVLDMGVRLLIWSASLAFASAAMTALSAWPQQDLFGADLRTAWRWGGCLAGWVILFNLCYVAFLLALRLIVPTPREGRYSTTSRVPDRQLIWSCLLATLTKARYEAPFPGFLVFHIANIPPMCWLANAVFGPRSRSCYVTDPRVLDPHLVTLGRNVVIGFNTTIAGHYQELDTVVFKRTIIEDDVVIGGHAVVLGGVCIQSGAMIGAGAVVLPGTIVGRNEFWAGVPARKLRDLPAPGAPSSPVEKSV